MNTLAVKAMLRMTLHPAFAAGPAIGSQGYAVPIINEPLVIPVDEANLPMLRERGIMIEALGGEGSIIVMDSTMPKLDIVCYFGGHEGCTVILGLGQPFAGRIHFSGPQAIFVSAGFGSMGGAARLAVTLNGYCGAYFGQGVTSVYSEWLAEGDASTPCGILVGDDCMMSWGIWCRNYDSHAVVDIETLSVINQMGNIVLGQHCWLGQDVRIARGVRMSARA
jgi:hypothetical protein